VIISHKYKFIFTRPTKVGGTSVEINLAKSCGQKDIITPEFQKHSKKEDSDFYGKKGQNYQGFYDHMLPKDIKKKVNKKIWDSYFKFTIVRNPWDLAVSRYWWDKTRGFAKVFNKRDIVANAFKPKKYIFATRLLFKLLKNRHFKVDYFENFVKNFKKEWTNIDHYFDNKEEPIADFYIRYENLEGDFKKVCNKLKIPWSKLPLTKDRIRRDKRHYSYYYNDQTRELIRQKFAKIIKYFDYKFEKQ
jgi:hypothetical protein